MKLNIIILFTICLGLYSCKKEEESKPAGVKTIVSGQFYDTFNQEAYPNLILKVSEYKEYYNFYGSHLKLVGNLDSTITDASGNYKINFTTTGNGSVYYLEFTGIPKNILVGDKGSNFQGPYYSSKKIENIGSFSIYSFELAKHYYMKTRITVYNNPYPPLNVNIGNSLQYILATTLTNVYGNNKDTVVNIPVRKNTSGFYVYFNIQDPTTKNVYKNAPILINPIINKDTIDGGQYILYPSTFK